MTALTVSEARTILDTFSCTVLKTPKSPAEKEQLQAALLLVTGLSEAENLGVCADGAEEGLAALNSYLAAMGYSANLPETEVVRGIEPVYIKYNTQKQSCYYDLYTGNYRGVLVSCQSEDDEINGTFGHLPLDLFE